MKRTGARWRRTPQKKKREKIITISRNPTEEKKKMMLAKIMANKAAWAAPRPGPDGTTSRYFPVKTENPKETLRDNKRKRCDE